MKQNIIFLGMTKNYPFEFNAGNTKTVLIGKGLQAAGDQVVVLGDIFGQKEPAEKPADTLPYRIFPTTPHRRISWFFNLFRIAGELKRRKCPGCRNIIIAGADFYPFYLIYVLMGRLLGYRIAVIYHEWHSFRRKAKLLRLWGGYLFDYTFGYAVQAILPISHFLEKHSRRFGKPMHIVPILAEYENVPPESESPTPAPQFVYCVHAGYLRVIKTILEAFRMFLNTHQGFRLALVVTGREDMIEEVRRATVAAGVADAVEIRCQVPFAELHRMYREAAALLIPLDPDSPQDQARFSQKIAEYLTSRRPVITTAVGEIPHYFEHLQDAVIAPKHTAADYAQAMAYCAEHPEEIIQIGKCGFELGESRFNYLTEGRKLAEFLDRI